MTDFVFENEAYYDVEDSSNNCEGCAFQNDSEGCSRAFSVKNCLVNEIIWVKKDRPNEITTDVEQGIKYDSSKLQYSLIPPLALEALARNLTAGLSKYPRDNWKKVENAEERYLDALYRHLEAYRKGELYDKESSVVDMPHMAAVAVNAMFLIEFMLNNNFKGE